MPNTDYYKTLSVSPEASPEDIKKAYRKLALETHPDRNPGDALAEERFKRINEAYGVLSDPSKRAQYDQFRGAGYHQRPGSPYGPGFGYSQEDIFRDFFMGGQNQDIFSEMQREFQRMGFRFDENFINHLFFGGKGTVFQNIFFSGPGSIRIIRFGTSQARRSARGPGRPTDSSRAGQDAKPKGLLESGIDLLARAGRKAAELIYKALGGDPTAAYGPSGRIGGRSKNLDLTYRLEISPSQARDGIIVEVELPHLEAQNKFSVRIPPGVQSGTRLRLKEMGRTLSEHPEARGDLYIELMVA